MNSWNSGLFDCFSDGSICFYGWCCTPCLYGENAQKIDGSGCFMHKSKRQTLRNKYGLPEDCNDCVATTFCAACAVCQEARELKFRSAPYGGPGPVTVQPHQRQY
ncbi:hypothetical protein I4U23_000733 [Adineta vaga]|nr:hypothetical protein I4U23_000733 [Adineta vaga]